MRAENEVYAEGSEGSIAVRQARWVLFVMHGNAHACSAQHTDERHIAHARRLRRPVYPTGRRGIVLMLS